MIKEEVIRQWRQHLSDKPQTFEFDQQEVKSVFQKLSKKYIDPSVNDEEEGVEGIQTRSSETAFLKEDLVVPTTQELGGNSGLSSIMVTDRNELNSNMFEALIRTLASKKQYSLYLQTLLSEDVDGFYAGTELGHGSDIYSIQTEAVVDPDSKILTVNTPSVTSIKLCTAGNILTASHVVFQARLVCGKKDYGVHSFLARIRHPETKELFEGLEVGRSYHKLSIASQYASYLKFTDFKLPRDALLSRFITISSSGRIEIMGDSRNANSTMNEIRCTLIRESWIQCFSILKKSQMRMKMTESHQAKQRAVSLTALGYASFLTWNYSLINMGEQVKEFLPILPNLKSFIYDELCSLTQNVLEFQTSGSTLGSINMWSQVEISPPKLNIKGSGYTYFQDTTKYIFKKLSKIMIGSEIKGFFSYLQDFLQFVENPPKIRFRHTVESLLNIIKASLLLQIKETGDLLKKKSPYSMDEKWNKVYFIEVNKTAKLNAVYLTSKIFYDQIQSLKVSDGLYYSLMRLCKIYCCRMVLIYCDNVILQGVLDSENLINIKEYMETLIDDAVPSIYELITPSPAEGIKYKQRSHENEIISDISKSYNGNSADKIIKNPGQAGTIPGALKEKLALRITSKI
ncbi:unnamed protein product [Moneuplotes crassus]|uniref:Acyl-CoA oxidase C-terminal domain-containing protein n=1 Tax=Euplotes crassus TaxID=5936 RepID=A0AAD2DB11_EUPCR|nr:unnamed protein product [Moneuplotes crassus]